MTALFDEIAMRTAPVRAPAAGLGSIPVMDARTGGLVRYAVEGRSRACELHDDCLAWLPPIPRLLLPLIDAATRRWLRRS